MYLEWSKSWPLESETRLLETPSGQTYVRVSGSVTDPPLVLLAGARGTSLMWGGMIAALSAHYRTYALDTMTDVGLSVPRYRMSTAEELVRWMDEVFRVLVPEGRLSVMGMSYGGWLASQYAQRFPDRLRKVILLAPGGSVLRYSLGFFARVTLLSMPFPGRHASPVARMFRWLFEDAVRSSGADWERIEQQLLAIVQSGRLLARPRMVWTTVLNDEEWRSFRVPALFLVGENEKIYPARAAVARLNRLAPRIRTEIIPGAGHDLTLVQPGLVARKVLEFLREPVTGSVPS